MPIKCCQCDEADLETTVVQLTGKVRGEDYAVEMLGLGCAHCKYQTIAGTAMPEYGRLLADKYRAAHGLLTSDDIRTRRERLGMSQQAFAEFLGVGVASVKRWEMGKIQDARSNALIVEKTVQPIDNVWTYALDCSSLGSTIRSLGYGGSCQVTIISTAAFEYGPTPNNSPVLMEQYLNNATKEPLYCCHCKQTGWTIELPNHRTVPPYMAGLFNRHRRKERHSHARPD
jgi:putative zinc finger/helix-turn-helix YgiT family protein